MGRKKKAVTTPTGCLPAQDPVMFKQIFQMICTDYDIKLNTDQLVANRMASTIMHIRKCEEVIADKGFCLEDANGEIRLNPFSPYLTQLNGELRAFMKALKPVKRTEDAAPQSFAALLAKAGEKK